MVYLSHMFSVCALSLNYLFLHKMCLSNINWGELRQSRFHPPNYHVGALRWVCAATPPRGATSLVGRLWCHPRSFSGAISGQKFRFTLPGGWFCCWEVNLILMRVTDGSFACKTYTKWVKIQASTPLMLYLIPSHNTKSRQTIPCLSVYKHE